MTPTERARQIDQQEFAAECKAALDRALAYSKQCRDSERRKVNVYMGRPEKAPERMSAKPTDPVQAKHNIDGASRTVEGWARHLGITRAALSWRCRKFGSLEAAVAMGAGRPPGRQPFVIEFEAQRRTIKEWAELKGIEPVTIHNRLRSGWSIADALTLPLGTKRGRPPGVTSNFAPSEGTGAGSTAQESPNITFSESAA